jgi:hypothetical protein
MNLQQRNGLYFTTLSVGAKRLEVKDVVVDTGATDTLIVIPKKPQSKGEPESKNKPDKPQDVEITDQVALGSKHGVEPESKGEPESKNKPDKSQDVEITDQVALGNKFGAEHSFLSKSSLLVDDIRLNVQG